MRTVPIGVPLYRPDSHARNAIVDPYPHYARLRELGPVVWLPKQRVYALTRFGECKAVVRNDTMFVSGSGVALNAVANRLSRGMTLNSDGAEHDQRRKLVAHRMLPRALRENSLKVQAGSRVLVIYSSANRDEREWDQPDLFDVGRDANRQPGFGHGSNACAGRGWPARRPRRCCAHSLSASTGSS